MHHILLLTKRGGVPAPPHSADLQIDKVCVNARLQEWPMAWLCIFIPHRWWHVRFGIWQCTRCKTLSLGRNPNEPPGFTDQQSVR
jgi:hypothetical protein